MTRRAALLLAAVCGLSGAACGSPSGQPAGPMTTVPAPSATTTSSVTTSTNPSVEVTGTLAEGVERGCLLLHPADGGEALLLLGATTGLTPGPTVTVRGAREPDVMTTCQQGVPFRVTEVL